MPSVRPNHILAFVAIWLVAALAACGGNTGTTATPAASATPTTAADRVQATQLVASASPTTAATPTSLASNLPTGTARSTEAARATGDTPTPLARITATSGTPATGATTAPSTVVGGTAARGTQSSGAATTSASGSATGTGVPPTTTPVPVTQARGTVEQFLRAVLAKSDIAGYLTPAFKSQVSGDGYKLLDIQPPVREFTVDSEQQDPDGNSATVRATITTAAGVTKRGFVMHKQGSAWLVDNIIS